MATPGDGPVLDGWSVFGEQPWGDFPERQGSKNLPEEIRELAPEIPWRMICGFRDHLAHAYFGLDDETVWEVVSKEIPPLLVHVERILTLLPPPS